MEAFSCRRTTECGLSLHIHRIYTFVSHPFLFAFCDIFQTIPECSMARVENDKLITRTEHKFLRRPKLIRPCRKPNEMKSAKEKKKVEIEVT